VGFEDQYLVSDCGRVLRRERVIERSNGHHYTAKEMELAQVAYGHTREYLGVGFKVARKTNRVFLVHRLVAAAFLPNPDGLPEVNHKDLDKRNNNVANLEWCGKVANQEHAAKRGRFHGRTNPNARFKLQPEQVDAILARLSAGEKGVDLAAEFNISPSMVYMIRKGATWADPAKVYAHVA